MRLPRIILACLAAAGLLSCSSPIVAQEGQPSGDRRDPVGVTAPVPLDTNPRVYMRAPEIGQVGSRITASGGVVFQQGSMRMTAGDAQYDTATRNGALKNVTFTTCPSIHPDYHFSARDIRLISGNRLRATNVSFFLGRFKVLTLPVFTSRVGSSGVARRVFPRPSFDRDDGFGLAQEFRLGETDRFHSYADLRVTTKRGLEGEVGDTYGIDGTLGGLPGRFLSYSSLRSSTLNVPRLPLDQAAEQAFDTTGVARFRQFGRFSLKQRTYDIRNTGLVVYRQPEIGVSYIGRALNFTSTKLDPRLELYPEVTASWGRFKEVPNSEGYTTRRMVSAAAGFNLLPLGRNTALQPVFLYSMSRYGDGDTYRTWGYSFDASHITGSGAMFTARYIRRADSGRTPFVFDSVEIYKEFQGGFQVPIGKHVVGFIIGYDGDTDSTYDWEVLYGYRTDCLAGWISWDSRFERFSVDVGIINL